jgi:hypothetical protein
MATFSGLARRSVVLLIRLWSMLCSAVDRACWALVEILVLSIVFPGVYLISSLYNSSSNEPPSSLLNSFV